MELKLPVQTIAIEKGKSLGLRLRQEEIATLNQLFKIDGFSSLSDLVHGYLRGELSKSQNTPEIERLFKRLRQHNITDPLSGEVTCTFYKSIDIDDFRHYLRN